MNRPIKISSIAFAILSVGSLVIFFQNCSQPVSIKGTSSNQSSTSALDESSDNDEVSQEFSAELEDQMCRDYQTYFATTKKGILHAWAQGYLLKETEQDALYFSPSLIASGDVKIFGINYSPRRLAQQYRGVYDQWTITENYGIRSLSDIPDNCMGVQTKFCSAWSGFFNPPGDPLTGEAKDLGKRFNWGGGTLRLTRLVGTTLLQGVFIPSIDRQPLVLSASQSPDDVAGQDNSILVHWDNEYPGYASLRFVKSSDRRTCFDPQ